MNKIILIRGPAGVGKSVLAKKLAKKNNAIYISYDTILKDNGLDKIVDGAIPLKNFLIANQIIVSKLQNYGGDVIIDGCMYYTEQLSDLEYVLNNNILIFSLTASIQTCIKRDLKRSNPLGEKAIADVYELVSSINIGDSVDTDTLSETETLDLILEKLRLNLPFRKNSEGYFFKGDMMLAKKTSFGIVFPGGGIDYGESSTEALIRETYEETGIKVSNLKEIDRLQFVWDKNWAHTEKQKNRYEQFQGEDMTFFTGEIESIAEIPLEEDSWSGELFMDVTEVISILEMKGSDEYTKKQLELVSFLLKNKKTILRKEVKEYYKMFADLKEVNDFKD